MTIPTERIRGRELQRIRYRHLREHPLCVRCQKRGYIVVATQVDHIIPLCHGGVEDESNRQSLCDECHRIKTAEDMGWRPRLGCNADGTPKDPSHPWNTKVEPHAAPATEEEHCE